MAAKVWLVFVAAAFIRVEARRQIVAVSTTTTDPNNVWEYRYDYRPRQTQQSQWDEQSFDTQQKVTRPTTKSSNWFFGSRTTPNYQYTFPSWNRYQSTPRSWNRYQTTWRPWNEYQTTPRPWNEYQTTWRPWNEYQTTWRPWNEYQTTWRPWNEYQTTPRPWNNKTTKRRNRIPPTTPRTFPNFGQRTTDFSWSVSRLTPRPPYRFPQEASYDAPTTVPSSFKRRTTKRWSQRSTVFDPWNLPATTPRPAFSTPTSNSDTTTIVGVFCPEGTVYDNQRSRCVQRWSQWSDFGFVG